MRHKTEGLRMKEWLPFLFVAWIIICSGSQHFRIYNSFFTNMFLLALAILYYLKKRVIMRANFITFLIILLYGGISTVYGVCIHGLRFNRNSFIIFCISCFALLILQSNMTKSDFKKKYIFFMTFETIISLVCFILVVYLDYSNLPGYYERIVPYTHQPGHNIVYLTPYYTMGWFSLNGFFKRNAGMFWEPGAHAVYIIIAILFAFSGALDGLKPKVRMLIVGILFLGVLSTKSTTGYMALALSFIFQILHSPQKWNTRKNLIIIMGVIWGIIFVALISGVFDKLIYRSGSFGTRMNDTVSGLSVAFQNVFLGKGMFVAVSEELQKLNVIYISNGLVSLMIGIGVPMTVVYLALLHTGIKRLFQASGVALCCVELIFLLFMCSESLCTYPIFLSLLFLWRNESNETGLLLVKSRLYQQHRGMS